MKIFQKILLAGEDVQSYTRSGRFYDANGKAAEVEDGALVVVGDLDESAVYANTKDLNVRKLSTPAKVTDEVAIVDFVGVNEADILGVRYRGDSSKTWGYPVPAGLQTRIRIPQVWDEFFIGADNFTSEPTVGQYATVTVGKTTFNPIAAPVKGQFCVKVDYAQTIVTGQVNNGVKYHCTVVARP